MRILKLLSILSLAGIFALCFFSWFSGDDLCYRNELVRYSVFEKAWLQYMHWDGRSLGIASLIQLTALKYFPPSVITLIWTAAFTGNAIMMLKIIHLGIPGSGESNVSVISVALLCSVMWLGLWKLIPDILYWPTGGWYCMMCLLGLCWIYLFKKTLAEKNFSSGKIVLIFILSFICGNNSHNAVIALILIAIIELLHSIYGLKNRKAITCCVFALTGLAGGASIVLFAPGNYERLHAIAWPGFNETFLHHIVLVFERYVYWLGALIILLLYIRWLYGKNFFYDVSKFYPSVTKFKSATKNKEAFIQSIHSYSYLIAALSTVIVFAATSFFAVPRTAIFFATYLVLFAAQRNRIRFEKINSKKFIYGSSVFLIFFIGIVAYEMIKVSSLKEKLSAREKIYSLNKGLDVTVDEIPVSDVPFAFTFVDISDDSSYWVNRCVALNHQLKTVRTAGK
jgi:hypothetical protein